MEIGDGRSQQSSESDKEHEISHRCAKAVYHTRAELLPLSHVAVRHIEVAV